MPTEAAALLYGHLRRSSVPQVKVLDDLKPQLAAATESQATLHTSSNDQTPTPTETQTSLLDPSKDHCVVRFGKLRLKPAGIKWFAEQINADDLDEDRLKLFIAWVCRKPSHYEDAKALIRELGLDQSYNSTRIDNVCLRKLVEDTREVRPLWRISLSDDRASVQDMLEFLNETRLSSEETLESAQALSQSPITDSSTASPLPASLALPKKRSIFRMRSQNVEEAPRTNTRGPESSMFFDHIRSPISSPLESRATTPKMDSGSPHTLQNLSPILTPGEAYELRSFSTKFALHTPDRPLPLDYLRARTMPKMNTNAARSVTSPFRLHTAPPGPIPTRPPPPLSPSLRTTTRRPSKYSLFPSASQTQPNVQSTKVDLGLKVNMSVDQSPVEGCSVTAKKKIIPRFRNSNEWVLFNQAEVYTLGELVYPDCGSEYSDTHKPLEDVPFDIGDRSESREDSFVYEGAVAGRFQDASQSEGDSEDWYTILGEEDIDVLLGTGSQPCHRRKGAMANIQFSVSRSEPVTPEPVTPEPVTPQTVTPKTVTPKPVHQRTCAVTNIEGPVPSTDVASKKTSHHRTGAVVNIECQVPSNDVVSKKSVHHCTDAVANFEVPATNPETVLTKTPRPPKELARSKTSAKVTPAQRHASEKAKQEAHEMNMAAMRNSVSLRPLPLRPSATQMFPAAKAAETRDRKRSSSLMVSSKESDAMIRDLLGAELGDWLESACKEAGAGAYGRSGMREKTSGKDQA